MSQNGQIHFKNLAAFAAKSLKCAWPFWDIMHEKLCNIHKTKEASDKVFCEKDVLVVW